MKDFINRLKQQEYWYLWVIGSLLMVLIAFGSILNFIPPRYNPALLAAATVLCCVPSIRRNMHK